MESMTAVIAEHGKNTERVSVDLPTDDYTELRHMAASLGRKVSMSSLIRLAVRDLLDRAEATEDAADIALATSRIEESHGITMTTAELENRLAVAGIL